MGNDIELDLPPALDWTPSSRLESLRAIREWAVSAAITARGWYWKHQGFKGIVGKFHRVSALVLATTAGALPLLGRLFPTDLDHAADLGYVLLIAAGGAVALDKFSGFSSAYVRYVGTATALETRLAKFHVEWVAFEASLGGKAPDDQRLTEALALVAQFVADVRALIESETAAWAHEFKGELARIEEGLPAAKSTAIERSAQLGRTTATATATATGGAGKIGAGGKSAQAGGDGG